MVVVYKPTTRARVVGGTDGAALTLHREELIELLGDEPVHREPAASVVVRSVAVLFTAIAAYRFSDLGHLGRSARADTYSLGPARRRFCCASVGLAAWAAIHTAATGRLDIGMLAAAVLASVGDRPGIKMRCDRFAVSIAVVGAETLFAICGEPTRPVTVSAELLGRFVVAAFGAPDHGSPPHEPAPHPAGPRTPGLDPHRFGVHELPVGRPVPHEGASPPAQRGADHGTHSSRITSPA